MNGNALKGLIISKGFTIITLLAKMNEKGSSMSKNTFYRNLNGVQEFDRKEIIDMAEILEMTDKDIMNIFFNENVS